MRHIDRRKIALARPFINIAMPIKCAILGAIIITSFYAVNRYTIFFNDSRSYIRGPAMAVKVITGYDFASSWRARHSGMTPAAGSSRAAQPRPPANHAYTANRSIFYGVLPFLGYLTGGFVLTAYIQAICVAYPMSILVVRILDMKPKIYFVLMGLLTYFTTLGPFVNFMMPDIFAPVMILSFSILFAYWKRLARYEIIILTGLMVFSTLCHGSHVAILLLLATSVGLISLLFRQAPRNNIAVTVALCAALVGLVGELAFDMAVHKVTGEKPLVLPHIVAHLIDMGPGYSYIVSRCPSQNLVICKYKDKLPQNWKDFLGGDPSNGVFAIAPLADKRKISEGQLGFSLAVLRYDPVGVAVGMFEDALKQFSMFSLRDLQVQPASLADYRMNWPDDVSRHIEDSSVGRGPFLLNTISVLGYLSVIGGIMALVVIGALERGTAPIRLAAPGFFAAGEVLLLGIFWNAIVCGMIASPYDRFQARVVWLVPMLALVAAAIWLRENNAAKL